LQSRSTSSAKFLNWCEARGYRERGSNSCNDIRKYKERKRDQFLSVEEFARLGDALLEFETSESPHAIAAIRLLIFTGWRLNEVLSLRNEDIDLANQRVYLRDTKSGDEYRTLNVQAIEIVKNIPVVAGNPYLICGHRKGTRFIGLQKVWERIRERAGLLDVRIHDFRHSYASFAVMDGLPLTAVGRLLGHSQPSVTDRYAHFAQAPLVQATDRVGITIDKMMHTKTLEP